MKVHWDIGYPINYGEVMSRAVACNPSNPPKETSDDPWKVTCGHCKRSTLFKNELRYRRSVRKLKQRIFVTTGDQHYGWQEYYSYADTESELEKIIETLLAEGYGLYNLSFWEPFEVPEGEPPTGTYQVVHYDLDYPVDCFDAPVREALVHGLMDIANRDFEEDGDQSARVRVWRRIELKIETKTRVTSVKKVEAS